MIRAWYFVFFLVVAEESFASTTCLEFFARDTINESHDGTGNLLAYWANLLEQQIIGEAELQRVVSGLEAGKLVNPITEEQSQVSSAALLHRNEIHELFDTIPLKQTKILRWAKKKLVELQSTKDRRDTTRVKTEDPHQKIEFYPIPSGEFTSVAHNISIPARIDHTFEMMSTLVTQKHWQDLMGDNPSHFEGLNNPVENISWWSALVFANKLSEKHGLKPVYKLKGISFTGEAAKGTLDAPGAKPKFNARDGNYYLAEGYRLPSSEEQEYVRGLDEADLKDHAWYLDNSGASTQPVAELRPLTINGNNFYDLFGNVSEWSSHCEIFQRRMRLPTWVYPGSETKSYYRGGAWDQPAQSCSSGAPGGALGGTRSDSLGLRLVRTIK